MNLLQVIKNADLIAKGKVRDISQTGIGSEIFAKHMALANILISEWENTMRGNEPIDWNSLFEPNFIIGQISAGQDTYEIPDEVRKILQVPRAKFVTRASNGREASFKLVSQVYASNMPRDSVVQTSEGFKFSRNFSDQSDADFVGADLTVPAFLYAPQMRRATERVPVDNPMWLVNRLAAELVRNDIVKQAQYTNLMQISNSLLLRMISENEGAQDVPTIPIETRPFIGTLIPNVR